MWKTVAIVIFFCVLFVDCQQPQEPKINWGKCSKIEPTEQDKQEKAKVIQGCLKQVPLPKNVTRESVAQHQREVAVCALNAENWFNEEGKYRYEKAERQIKSKKLEKEIETKILFHHNKCKREAQEKTEIIEEVQLYQACMDYYIAQICEITVN
ncbi:hypothetical protein B4U79_03099 [Dinothrombium tinctorium]|uniref:Uncharacterized protein n=1 Tax=Dinothrombium tinctorium TaxID=1965070 RepID=A0A443QYM5_9ACAR|nr:hypothetical protein B4U79_11820 [Dinothrombium tinctorium]RWS08114.1 hypothetical protein B4U79_03099 [Dinothrombium tinctorium]